MCSKICISNHSLNKYGSLVLWAFVGYVLQFLAIFVIKLLVIARLSDMKAKRKLGVNSEQKEKVIL
jgi:hypothetical protein